MNDDREASKSNSKHEFTYGKTRAIMRDAHTCDVRGRGECAREYFLIGPSEFKSMENTLVSGILPKCSIYSPFDTSEKPKYSPAAPFPIRLIPITYI